MGKYFGFQEVNFESKGSINSELNFSKHKAPIQLLKLLHFLTVHQCKKLLYSWTKWLLMQ